MTGDELFLERISIDWGRIPRGSYLRQIPALSGLHELGFSRPVTFFSGENGSGKSTLLEALAIASGFNPEGGTKNYAFSTHDSHSELFSALRLTRSWRFPKGGYFLRAESFYNVASAEEEYSQFGGTPQHFHERSHGESFLKLAQNSFRPDGLYFLDEPEAALSPQRQLTLLLEIYRCAAQGSQFIIASHSPILLGFPDAEILQFGSGAIRPCPYEETESYQLTRLFVNNRQQILRRLLEEDARG